MLLTFTFVVYFKFPVVTESGQYGASSFAIQNIMWQTLSLFIYIYYMVGSCYEGVNY